MITWLYRKSNHIIAKVLIKDADWHLLLCDCGA